MLPGRNFGQQSYFLLNILIAQSDQTCLRSAWWVQGFIDDFYFLSPADEAAGMYYFYTCHRGRKGVSPLDRNPS